VGRVHDSDWSDYKFSGHRILAALLNKNPLTFQALHPLAIHSHPFGGLKLLLAMGASGEQAGSDFLQIYFGSGHCPYFTRHPA
jgi:hypothetical protein